VIVPTRDRPALLRDALASVAAQTVDDFEVIVVDDAGEQPVEIPDDPRFRVVRRTEPGGPSGARNTGLEHATGRIVTFLDDDDVWLPGRLALAADGHQRGPLVICWATRHDGEGGRRLDGDVGDVILDTVTPSLNGTSVERSRCLPFDDRYRACGDVDWWLRTARQIPVVTVPEAGARIRPAAVDDAPHASLPWRIGGHELLLDDHREWFRSHPRAEAFRLFRAGLTAQALGDPRLARRFYARSFRRRPSWRPVWHSARTVVARRKGTGTT
jgi:glycosyltransferase involved in cell wall biosynthesis